MLDLTKLDKALKIKYSDEEVINMAYQEEPLLAILPKSEKFGGKSYQYSLITSNPQNASATFADGQGNDSSTEVDSFNIQRVSFYSFAQVDGETLEATMNDEDSMLEALETEIDGALLAAKTQLSGALFRTKAGIIGKVASISGSTVTLAKAEDIVHIERGMILGSSLTEGSGSAKTSYYKVVSRNPDNGSFVVDSVTGLAVNDFLFRKGNYNKSVSGLADWLPWTAPTSGDNFFGTDRSTDVVKLAGNRIDISAKPLSEGLVAAASKANRNGAKISHFIMNDDTFTDLANALGAKVVYGEVKVGEIGFSTIKIHTSKGTVECVADRNCPSDLVYGLTMKTWQLRTLGKAVRFFDYTGKMITMSSKDAVEARVGYRGNLLCKAPGHNIVCKIK